MEIIDIQVHTGPAKEGWLDRQQAIPFLLNGDAFPIEAVLIAVDAVGISRVVVDGPDDYGQAAARRFPTRVAWCAHFDRKAPNIEELIGGAAQLETPPLATRISIRGPEDFAELDAGAYERHLTAAEKAGLPVFCNFFYTPGVLERAHPIPRKHPNLLFVIDHLGMPHGPTKMDVMEDPPFKQLNKLLEYAQYPNVALKFCGAPAFSRESYPFRDIWPAVHQIVKAFGPERMMWASDPTRLRPAFAYHELVDWLRYTNELSQHEKEMILGGSARRLLKWPGAKGGNSTGSQARQAPKV